MNYGGRCDSPAKGGDDHGRRYLGAGAIAKGEVDAPRWIDLLAAARADGDLVICDVVAAEFFALLLDERKFQQSLTDLGIAFSPAALDAARLAGRIFRVYRRKGGPRRHLVPDFLIGAHAQRQADQIAAIDRGYLRHYFSRLRIVRPAQSRPRERR